MAIQWGKVGYEAYGEQVGWKAYNGEAMPQWEQLPQRIQDAWHAAASAIEDAVLKCDYQSYSHFL